MRGGGVGRQQGLRSSGLSRPRELYERAEVGLRVRMPQGLKIAQPPTPLLAQVARAPRKYRLTERLDQQVRRETSVSAIPVRKRMHYHKPMMEPCGGLVSRPRQCLRICGLHKHVR